MSFPVVPRCPAAQARGFAALRQTPWGHGRYRPSYPSGPTGTRSSAFSRDAQGLPALERRLFQAAI